MGTHKPTHEGLRQNLSEAEESVRAMRSHGPAVGSGDPSALLDHLSDVERSLRSARLELENNVIARTAELAAANAALEQEIEERRNTEFALLESKRILANAQRVAHFDVWEWDIKTGEVKGSGEKFQPNTDSPGEATMSFEAFSEAVHPDDREAVSAALKNALDGKARYDIEFRIIGPDNSIRNLHSQAEVYRDADGRPLRMVGTGFDITDRKEAEQALRESQRTLFTLMGNLPGMAYRCRNDKDWTMEFVSEGCLDLTGYRADDLQDNRRLAYADVIHPDDRDRVWQMVQSALESHLPFELDYRIITAAGVEKRVWEKGRGVFNDAGELIALEGFVNDVNDREQAREALRDSEARFRAIFEQAAVGVALTDTSTGRIVRVNQKCSEILGRPRDEITASTFRDLTHPDDLQTDLDNMKRLKAGLIDSYSMQKRFYRPEGSTVWVNLTVSPMWKPGDDPTFCIAVVEDITDRKRAEKVQERLTTILEATPDFIGTAKPDGRVLYLSSGARQMVGIGLGEDVTRARIDQYSPEWAYRIVSEEGVPSAIRDGIWAGETAMLTRDGREIPVSQVILAHRNPANEVEYLSTIARDITDRKQAEEALRKSQALYATAERLGHVGSWKWDLTTGEVEWSDEVYRIYGLEPDYFQPQIDTIMELFHPDDRRHFNEVKDQIASDAQIPSFEARILRPDGSVRTTFTTVEPKYDAAGELITAAGCVHDITERKQAEEALRKSEARYAIAERLGHLGSWQWDVRSGKLEWSDEVYRIFGQDPDLFEPHIDETTNLVHADDRNRYERLIEELTARKETESFELRIIRPDGSVRWLYSIAEPQLDAAGQLVEIVGSVLDITEQKQADEALRESEERRALAQRIAGIGTWVWDFRTESTYLSDEAREIFALKRGESGTSLADMKERIHPEDGDRVEKSVQANLEGGEEHRMEYRIVWPDGSIHWVSSLGDAERDSQGRLVRFLGVVMDITESKEMELQREQLDARLRQAQKMEAIGQLAGGVAHDFNNILTAIFGNVEMASHELRSFLPEDSHLFENLRQIEQGAARAASLTRQLLAFSRRQIVQPEVLDLNRTLGALNPMLRRLITENIQLRVTMAPDLRCVLADAGQIEQVIINLAVNARDAMPDGGRLAFETGNVTLDADPSKRHPEASPGSHVLLSVCDTGMGMDDATRERIFEPFFTTKPFGEGTGLGLSTVYGIVKQAGGYIQVLSEPEHGTTFQVYIPAIEEEARATREVEAEAPISSGTGTILVCEDDTAVRDLTAYMLSTAGYKVLTADGAAQASALTADEPIDLLITDVIMPDTNGKELSEKLTKLRPDLRTLFVSGYTSDLIAHHGVLEQGVAFLEKPFSREKLIRRVREMLDGD